ncbi:MAG: dTMP kinase [Campylobacterales bacterium]|nr:dTMP kinase [Campylobacterales bacterium]
MYIVIEGIDTAGKSTQLDILKNKFPNAIFTKEPGGTQLGLKLRSMALNGEASSKVAEMFLFLADRAEHAQKVIKNNRSKMVISDRGFLSGIAYCLQFEIQTLIPLNLLALDNNIPSKIIILKLTKEELEYRLSQKENDSIESRGSEYLLSIQGRMLEAIEIINQTIENKIDLLVVDASHSIEVIAQQIEDFLKQ